MPLHRLPIEWVTSLATGTLRRRPVPRPHSAEKAAAAAGSSLHGGLIVLYVAAAGLCFWAAIKERAAQKHTYQPRVPRFWFVMGGLLTALGLLRLLDLHSWLDSMGRSVARSEGWYAQRRPMQTLLIVQGIIVGLGVLGLALWYARKIWRRYLLAIGACIALLTVVFVRAVSLHQVDHFLKDNDFLGLSVGTWIEGLPLLAIGLAAAQAIRRDWQPRLQAFEKRVRIR